MKWLAAAADRRVIACILAIGLFQQVTVLPILHLLHGAGRPAGVRAASLSDPAACGITDRSLTDGAARHDAGACPTCAALAQQRGGAVAPPAVWHVPQGVSSPVMASTGTLAPSAIRLVAAPRAPPLLAA